MTAPVFVDTNVLVYAIDQNAGDRHSMAREWMAALWERRDGRLSMQVLQEFYATITRKLRPGLSPTEAREEVQPFLVWAPVEVTPDLMRQAWQIESRFQLSWWDALIVASAQAAGCRTLLTEDLQHGQQLDGVEVVNPFRTTPSDLFGRA